MKNLKLLFLTLLSVLSFNLFSQNMVITTQTSGPNVCDGTAVLDTTNVNMTSIYWQGMGMIINQGSYIVTNLCPGTYTVNYTVNGFPVTYTFVITSNPCFNFTATLQTTNQTSPALCDGMISMLVNGGTAPYMYTWTNGANTQTITQLCSGSYCGYVTDANGCTLSLCDSIGATSPMIGDTLIINSGSNCNNPIGTMTVSFEDCNLDFNAVDTAYISSITLPANPMDSTLCVWSVVDTNGVAYFYTVYYNTINQGCYNLQFVLYCYQKNMNYKTIIMTQGEYINIVGINELTPNSRKLIKVLDIMGREVSVQPNKPLIYVYSDGTREMWYISH